MALHVYPDPNPIQSSESPRSWKKWAANITTSLSTVLMMMIMMMMMMMMMIGTPLYDLDQQHDASGASSVCQFPLVDMLTNLVSL